MADLYQSFLEAGRTIATSLGIKNLEGENRKLETPKIGADYSSRYENDKISFNFYLRTESEGCDLSKWKELSLSLYFYNGFDLCQFSRHELFNHNKKVDMKKWATEKGLEYNNMRKRNDLSFLFGDRDIRVRGIADITNATLIEFVIILKGYIAWGSDRLLVYRFHHGKVRMNR